MNHTRTLQSGRKVEEITEVIDLKLSTQCPKKWIVLDLETGDAWSWGNAGWSRATEQECEEAKKVLDMGKTSSKRKKTKKSKSKLFLAVT